MPIQINANAPIADTFRRLREYDPNLDSDNFDVTLDYCEEVFNDNKPIDELLRLGPIDLGGIEWDFELNNGIRSLVRRGFYKIIETPFERDINGIMTWSAKVLFAPSSQHPNYFKFLANVGPLVNGCAMCYNFTGYGPDTNNGGRLSTSKRDFFMHMIGKVFYVSQQMYLGDMKQTVWFKFQ